MGLRAYRAARVLEPRESFLLFLRIRALRAIEQTIRSDSAQFISNHAVLSENWKLLSLRSDETFLYRTYRMHRQHDGNRRQSRGRSANPPIYPTMIRFKLMDPRSIIQNRTNIIASPDCIAANHLAARI